MIATPAMRGVRGAVIALVLVGVVVARAEVLNRIVATIDGEPITVFEVARYGETLLGERRYRGEIAQIAGDATQRVQCVCDAPLISQLSR